MNAKADRRSTQVRLPEFAVGTLIVAACVLGALLWQRSVEKGTAVLVAGRDLRRGQVLEQSDLAAVVVNSDQRILLLKASAVEQVVGLRVTTDIPSGTPITATQVADVEPVTRGQGVVGLTVSDAEAPADLAAGDAVRLFSVNSEVDGSRLVGAIGTTAVIWEVGEADGIEGRRSMSLRIPLDSVDLILGHDELHVVKVGP